MSRICVPVFACGLLLFSFAGAAGEKETPEDSSSAIVRLRFIDMETSVLGEHYRELLKRQLAFLDSVRASARSGERLGMYEQALQDAQADLASTQKSIVTLERERAKLVERLGKKNAGDASLEYSERTNRTLEKILETLGKIEKRLEKIGR